MILRVFQHVPFEGPQAIAGWAAARGVPIAITRWFAGDVPPAPADDELLIVLGGPMGVHDEATFPWLAAEKAWLAGQLAAGRPALGICLGAQLMAAVLGARVYPNPHREIGWFPVTWTPEAAAWQPAGAPASCTVFHWHGDTFDLPDGAECLASSAACRNQAFRYGARAVGLQFHLETTPRGVDDLIAHAGGELGEGPWMQRPEELRSGTVQCAALHPRLFALLDALAAGRGAG